MCLVEGEMLLSFLFSELCPWIMFHRRTPMQMQLSIGIHHTCVSRSSYIHHCLPSALRWKAGWGAFSSTWYHHPRLNPSALRKIPINSSPSAHRIARCRLSCSVVSDSCALSHVKWQKHLLFISKMELTFIAEVICNYINEIQLREIKRVLWAA